MDPLLGQTVGSYQLTQILGTGGMGRVYLGVQPAIGSQVAVKVLSVESSQRRDLVDRFFAEAKAVNHIRHENIVNVLDLAFLSDGRPYIVMERLEGRPLKEVLGAGGFLPLGSVTRVFEDILDALAAAHDKGVVHRDLKPDNIFVTPTGRAKVLDFGIAKLMPEYEAGGMQQATRTGQVLGTPSYMAPEQVTGGVIGPWTDLYALGVILYEACTGRVPFKADTLFALLQKHVTEVPTAPRVLRPELPKALADVVMQALDKDVARRFQSATEMMVALEAASKMLPAEHWTALSLVISDGAHRLDPLAATPATAPTVLNPPLESAAAPAVSAPAFPQADPAPMPHMADTPRMAGSSPSAFRSLPIEASAQTETPVRSKSKQSSTAVLIAIVVAMAAVGAIGGYYVLVAVENDDSVASPGAPEPDRVVDNDETSTQGGDPGDREPEGGEPNAEGGSETAQSPPEGGNSATATPSKRPPAVTTSDNGAVTFVNTATLAIEKTGIEPLVIKPAFDTSKFDGTAFVPKAEVLARKLMSDAFLVEFDVEAVSPDGTANLKYGEATFEFRSPSRSKRPDDVPKNVELDIPCKVYVEVSETQIEVYPVTDEKCAQKKRPTPKCSLKQVWAKAIAQGATSDNVVAEINYLWDDWTLSVGEFYASIPDDC